MIALPIVVGLVVGAFLDVVTNRIPRGKPAFALPVRCRYCRTPLGLVDLLPVVGLLLSRGSCRSCGHRLPLRPLLLAVTTAAALTALFLRFGPTWTDLSYSVYSAVLVAVFVMDLEHFLIPNVVTYPSIVLALILMFVAPGPGIRGALLGGLFYGGLFLALYLLSVVIYKSDVALGLGDVKLALLIGLVTGMPGAITAALLGTVLGAIFGIGLMAARRGGAKSMMPYGTALSLGAFFTMLWSPWIV